MSKVKQVHIVRISNLKRMRVKRGLTQKELADRSGIPLKSIGNYEQLFRDINHARFDIVYRLACALECDVLDIVETGWLPNLKIDPEE